MPQLISNPFLGELFAPFHMLCFLLGAGMIAGFYLLINHLQKPKNIPGTEEELSPPDDLSPAAISYIRNKGYSPKTLTACLFSVFEKGVYKLKTKKDGTFGAVRNAAADTEALSLDEKAAFSFNNQGKFWKSVSFSGASKQLQRVDQRCVTMLDKSYGDLYRELRNFKFIGIGLSVLVFFGLSFLLGGLPMLFTNLLFVGIAGPFWAVTVWMVFKGIQSQNFGGLARAVLGVVMSVGVTIPFLEYLGGLGILIPAIFTAINLVAWQKVKVYSQEGAELANRIEKFKASLLKQEQADQQGVEQDPFEVNNYKNLVSYRIALGLEDKLASKWSTMMRKGQWDRGISQYRNPYGPVGVVAALYWLDDI